VDLLHRRDRGLPGPADRQRRRDVVTTPQQQVFALDAKTGDLLWRYKKEFALRD
jgi:hypothetical protein